MATPVTKEQEKIFQERMEMLLKSPETAALWHLYNPDDRSSDINVLDVWKRGNFGGGVNVVVIDFSGDNDHEDIDFPVTTNN